MNGQQSAKVGNQFKDKYFIGQVVDNNDPLRLQRVRIRVPEIFEGVPDDMLPWALPRTSRTLGMGGGSSSCYVPVIDSLVFVEFERGESHFPIYNSSPVTPATINALFATNYPHRYGEVDRKGNKWYVDQQTGDTHFEHFSGTTLHISPDGAVSVVGVSTGSIDFSGALTINSDTSIQLTAPRIDMN